MRNRLLCVVGVLAAAIALSACTTAPAAKTTVSSTVAAVTPTAIMVLADGAVGVAVSKGVSPALIASGAYQLGQLASGQVITVQAITTEIQALETKGNLNVGEVAAITELRTAFDTIIAGYVQGGALPAAAQTTLAEIFGDVVSAAELLGAPNPAVLAPGTPAAPATPATSSIGPPAPSSRQSALSMLESPAVVGASTSTLIVASLQAFKGITVAAPAAAAITVVGTFLAALIAAQFY